MDHFQTVIESLTLSESVTATPSFVGALSETITLTESLTVSHASSLSVSESLTLQENAQAAIPATTVLDGTSFRISWPRQVGLDIPEILVIPQDSAYPVLVTDVAHDIITESQGTAGRAYFVDASGITDRFTTGNLASFRPESVGNYLRILTGVNAGTYRIEEYVDGATVRIAGTLQIVDPANGYRWNRVIIRSVPEKSLQFPDLVETITGVARVENRTNGDAVDYPDVTLLDIDIFEVDEAGFVIDDEEDYIWAAVMLAATVEWEQLRAASSSVVTIAPKFSGNATYRWVATVQTRFGGAAELNDDFTTTYTEVAKPQVVSAEADPDDGSILVTFDTEMRTDDEHLMNPADYVLTGGSSPLVKSVRGLSPTQVVLETTKLTTAGSYTLTVSTSTPKDIAGNPIDPSFNDAVFSATVPTLVRSIFTDKGPISKPALTLQSGSGVTFVNFFTVTLTGATLTSAHVGKYVRLTGASLNSGTFRISAVLTSTRARLANASFSLPDVTVFTWTLFDPRDGQIADDPADVTVRINSVPVTPTAVIGLLGQIVLPTMPDADDDVKVDYSWIPNPTVEIRRTNSREFRTNSDIGLTPTQSHVYRYRCVTVNPDLYDADDMQADLPEPAQIEHHYRAFERAYTPLTNDPSTLLTNAPHHKVAYPTEIRYIEETSVGYEATVLPHNDGWELHGSGSASVLLGRLTAGDPSTGAYPDGHPLFWSRLMDLTFAASFAMTWRGTATAITTSGVFTGVAAGYSTATHTVLFGMLESSGVKKVGFLLVTSPDDPSDLSAWTSANHDWSVLTSYRVFRDPNGTVSLYVDGETTPLLQVQEEDGPLLEQVDASFEKIRGVFFGSVSRPAANSSTWDFVRFLTLPVNLFESYPSKFVDFDASVLPEADSNPWTVLGFHGNGKIVSGRLLLDSTSAATDTADIGLVGADFRGYLRMEPLLQAASQFAVDAQVQVRSQTYGTSPNGCFLAVDDGTRLLQLSFLSDTSNPKLSYGGRSDPTEFGTYGWQALGGAAATMSGRTLVITDSSTSDGKVFYVDDTEPDGSDTRTISGIANYAFEFRAKVISYTQDGAGFAGTFAQVFDGTRLVGVMLAQVAGVRYVSFHSDGTQLGPSHRFTFNWNDGQAHSYRVTKAVSGGLVSIFVDGTFLGSTAYTNFTASADPVGQFSFGSSTALSSSAVAVTQWSYANAWRFEPNERRYVGLWRGTGSTLLDYDAPTKQVGYGTISGATLADTQGNFTAVSVAALDLLLIDDGPNRGIYEVVTVSTSTSLTVTPSFSTAPSVVRYRILKETDWTLDTQLRMTRDGSGAVNVYIAGAETPAIAVGYGANLPESSLGIPYQVSALPSISFGSMDRAELAQSSWDSVKYGITRSVTELGIAPHHQITNQWNVMNSPERLFTVIPHTVLTFQSSSTGILPTDDPDFMEDPGLQAFTTLNAGTPIVPRTQNMDGREASFITTSDVADLSSPENVLENSVNGTFVTNDGHQRIEYTVPSGILYSTLQVVEQLTGEPDLIAPCDDEDGGFMLDGVNFNQEVCLSYNGSVLPENDTTASTPWTLQSDTPAQVNTSISGGALIYGTNSTGTATIYRNDTPLPDSVSLVHEVAFTVRVDDDSTLGTGDSQIRLGLSAPGFTIGLAFVTEASGQRLIKILDLNANTTVGALEFDFLDGNYHTYRILRDPSTDTVSVTID